MSRDRSHSLAGEARRLFKQAQNTRFSGTSSVGTPEWIREQIVSGYYTRERACDDKIRFGQYAHVEKARGDIEARHNEPGSLQVYPCPFCGGWHLASAKDVDEIKHILESQSRQAS